MTAFFAFLRRCIHTRKCNFCRARGLRSQMYNRGLGLWYCNRSCDYADCVNTTP